MIFVQIILLDHLEGIQRNMLLDLPNMSHVQELEDLVQDVKMKKA